MVSQIYRDGRHYDRLFTRPAHPEDEAFWDFWRAQARQTGGAVLELACGTGALAIPLAQAGLTVTGLDNAEPMLTEARRKSAAAGVAVEWVVANMAGFDLGRRFGLIILAANSLCHLLDRSALEGCLASVRRHLAPGGRLVIDVFVPDLRRLTRPLGSRHPFARYDDPDGGGEVIVTQTNTYEPDTQINRVRTYHRLPGQTDEVVGHLDLRMYYPQELDALLAYNGLAIERKLADYDGEPFGPAATRQLLLCKAT
jgi:SAM-dependent methyltransferase